MILKIKILDQNTLKGEYRLGLIRDIHPSKDGRIRTVSVGYKNFKVGEKMHEYKGQEHTVVKRSVQRLVLLVPVKE